MNLVKMFRTGLLILVPVLLLMGLYVFSVFLKTSNQDFKVVQITPDGFVPSEFIIKKGEKVIWLNESGTSAWPASDLHPTHTIYPEFDPLEPISLGQAWVFTFDKAGVWRFHDHLKPSRQGVVKVIE